MSDGYGSTRATTTWISSDGTVTNHDQDTEMGFWVRLFHNECDRSASLEREIERLRGQLALTEKWRDNFKLAFEKERKNTEYWYGIALAEEQKNG